MQMGAEDSRDLGGAKRTLCTSSPWGKVFWSGGQAACTFRLSLRCSVCSIQHEVNRTREWSPGGQHRKQMLATA